MAERALVLDGSTKKIFNGDQENQIILEFKDSEAEFDGEKKAKFKNKGVLRKEISKAIYEFLGGYNIPNHYLDDAGDAALLVRKLDMIPITVVIRNMAAGSLCKRFKIKEGTALKYPVIEYYLKDKKLKNMFIAESHAYAFSYTTPEEMKHIVRLSSKVNAVLKSFMDRRRLKLVDYKLEFGRYSNQIYLGDEITPDTTRIWKLDENNLPDKDFFQFGNSKAGEAYSKICERIIGK